jgi:SAM-dependent methyltransferase
VAGPFSSSALWTSSAGSRWQRAKRPQLEWMIAQIKDVIQSHPDHGKRRLRVVDVGGGKGYLANLVAEQLSDVVDVRVVDISARAINNGMMRARRRNLDNIEYNVGDATSVDMEGVDVVVALHACGALSDVAMGHAVANGAAFVVCPCCFRSNPHLRVRIPGQRPLVTVSEWLQTDHQDVHALQQLAEVQGDIQMAGQAIHSICALRAAAARYHYSTNPSDNDLAVQIKTFPISFSTRNFCIVGTVQQKPYAH